jgi:hypothetical protein
MAVKMIANGMVEKDVRSDDEEEEGEEEGKGEAGHDEKGEGGKSAVVVGNHDGESEGEEGGGTGQRVREGKVGRGGCVETSP